MSIETAPACVLGLTHEALSALRDGLLSVTEHERLQGHVASCSTCEARLADFDAIAAELRRQHVPEPDARLWAAVRSAATQPRRAALPPQLPQLPQVPPKQVWGALGAVAAILLVVVGFARLLSSMNAHPTATPTPTTVPNPTVTPTPLPAYSLSWQPGTAPIRLVREVSPPVLAPSPTDGRVAYLCGADWPPNTTDVQPQVWVTTDRAAHWTLVTTIPLRRHYNRTAARTAAR